MVPLGIDEEDWIGNDRHIVKRSFLSLAFETNNHPPPFSPLICNRSSDVIICTIVGNFMVQLHAKMTENSLKNYALIPKANRQLMVGSPSNITKPLLDSDLLIIFIVSFISFTIHINRFFFSSLCSSLLSSSPIPLSLDNPIISLEICPSRLPKPIGISDTFGTCYQSTIMHTKTFDQTKSENLAKRRW